MTFAISLIFRYHLTFVNDDYEEAASILDDIIARSPGNSPDESVAEYRAKATGLVTLLTMKRSALYPTPEYLEEAIYRTRTCASSSSVKEHLPSLVLDLEATSKERSRYFGSIAGVEAPSGQWLSLGHPEELTIDKMKKLRFEICSQQACVLQYSPTFIRFSGVSRIARATWGARISITF